MLMLDVAVCLMCLMRLLMWLLAHAVDGCVDMDGCFVFALCLFFWWWTIERARLNTLLRSRVSLSLWLPTQLTPMAALTRILRAVRPSTIAPFSCRQWASSFDLPPCVGAPRC